jgi:hypothetical protein
MADVKISELPAYPAGISPLPTDVLPIVDTSETTFVTRKITIADISIATQLTPLNYTIFTASAAGGPGQSFTDANLTVLTSVGQSTVVVDGVVMTPNENYNIMGAQINVLDYLPPNAQVEVIYKVLPNAGSVNDITLQNGIDIMVDQNNDSIITQ